MNQEILISAKGLKKYFPVKKFLGGKTQYVKAVDNIDLDIRHLRNFWSVTGRNHLQRQDRQKHFQSMKTSVERAFISKGEKNGI